METSFSYSLSALENRQVAVGVQPARTSLGSAPETSLKTKSVKLFQYYKMVDHIMSGAVV